MGTHGDGGTTARGLVRNIAVTALAEVWSRCAPRPPLPKGPPRIAPSDNLQRTMNLIIPLPFPSLATRGDLARILFEASDQIVAGLNNVGTVHFARFDIVAGNLCMFSIYDGEFGAYIREFIAAIGSAFDALLACVKDPPPTPVSHHVDEFVEWVRERDAFQMPEVPTDLVTGGLIGLQRDTLIALHRHRNVQLAFYSAYPGFSAAQVRDRLSLGW